MMKRAFPLLLLVLCGPAKANVVSIPVTPENVEDLAIPLKVVVAQELVKEDRYLRFDVSTTVDPDVEWLGELYIPKRVRASLRPRIQSDTISWSVSLGSDEVEDAVVAVAAADPSAIFGYTLWEIQLAEFAPRKSAARGGSSSLLMIAAAALTILFGSVAGLGFRRRRRRAAG